MAQLVASLHDEDGRVAVAGFYDDVRELPASERAEIAALPFDEADYLRQVGAPEAFGEPGYGTLERLWTRPTLEVNGMWGGYEGPGSKTVTPSEAHAKISCRLVPDQDPHDIAEKVVSAPARTSAAAACGWRSTRATMRAMPYRIAADHPALATAAAALQDVYGVPPLFVRMGGTVPVCEAFKQTLGLDTVFFSWSVADEDFHAPNEFFRVNRIGEGLAAWARLWQRLGETGGLEGERGRG